MELIEELILANLNSSRVCRSDAKVCVSLWASIRFCRTSVLPEKNRVGIDAAVGTRGKTSQRIDFRESATWRSDLRDNKIDRTSCRHFLGLYHPGMSLMRYVKVL